VDGSDVESLNFSFPCLPLFVTQAAQRQESGCSEEGTDSASVNKQLVLLISLPIARPAERPDSIW